MAYPQESYVNTTFQSPSFIQKRRNVVSRRTLHYQLDVLKKTERYDAFKLQWHPIYDEPPNVLTPKHLFWDSDVAKWIEGACYFLVQEHNQEIDTAVKDLVAMIREAQHTDGYLNIHFTIVDPKGRFTNLRDMHELYNAGHLVEAALAHNNLYGNDLLLSPLCKYMDLLCETFGPGDNQKHGYPGHPEIELSLLRLSARTRTPRYAQLAKYFLEERGNPVGQDGKHYYDFEAEARKEPLPYLPDFGPAFKEYWYHQAHMPIVKQPTIEGHSVRAMYLLTAYADLIRLRGVGNSETQYTALVRLWDNMVNCKMSLTGGIGAQDKWEGFGIDYFLPQSTDEGGCYNETCAGIGVMMLAERLLQIDLDGRFADVMELCFYNTVLTGMSSCGTRFTYVNQLASSDKDLSKREEWFTCACCPPNVTRLLGYIGGYLWTHFSDVDRKTLEIHVHMYGSATLRVPHGKQHVELHQSSNWPWSGNLNFRLSSPVDVATTVKLRIPKWADRWTLDPPLAHHHVEKGYLELPPSYTAVNHTFTLDIVLSPRLLTPHPYTNQNIVALSRGPIVYCLEDANNPWVDDHFKSLGFDTNAMIEEQEITDDDLAEPYVALSAKDAAYFLDNQGQANDRPSYVTRYTKKDGVETLNFIPYAMRDNRGGKGHMRVGLRRMLK